MGGGDTSSIVTFGFLGVIGVGFVVALLSGTVAGVIKGISGQSTSNAGTNNAVLEERIRELKKTEPVGGTRLNKRSSGKQRNSHRKRR